MGRFKAPTLRNIAVTAPYMHDGSVATLGDVLDHYAAGGRTLTATEKADLIAFLESLTDRAFLGDPRFRDPARR